MNSISQLFYSLLICLILHETAFGLPSKGLAGHDDLTRMSAQIKYNLDESNSNGLRNSINDRFKSSNNLKAFQDFLSTSNVSEDQPGAMGMFHFYSPDTEKGLFNMLFNAKDRATDFYNNSMYEYCGTKGSIFSAAVLNEHVKISECYESAVANQLTKKL